MKDTLKWARLIVCIAFHMIFTGLAGAILNHLFGVSRPEAIIFITSDCFAVGWLSKPAD